MPKEKESLAQISIRKNSGKMQKNPSGPCVTWDLQYKRKMDVSDRLNRYLDSPHLQDPQRLET